jgi:hypothetical protein
MRVYRPFYHTLSKVIFLLFFQAIVGAQGLKINEIMSSNLTTIQDEDGMYSDWIEIFNSSQDTLSLDGYGLTDNLTQPFKWTFPDIKIAPGEYLMVWASGKDRRPEAPQVRNLLLWEIYLNIPGTSLDQLINHPSFPDQPDERNFLSNGFSTPENIDDDYGARVQGYFTVPMDGNYTFWISGDDQSKLYLSLSGLPQDTFLIAEVPEWSLPWEFDKYPNQRSAPVMLFAGQTYYLMGLMKEGGGGDHLRVRWQLPNAVMQDPMPAEVFAWESFELHTNFSLSSSGEPVQLTAPDGTVVDSFNPVLLRPDLSYGRSPDGSDELRFFDKPTPGASNGSGGLAILDKVAIHQKGQLYQNSTFITLSHTDPTVQIRYTLNGHAPTIQSSLYTGPVLLTQSVVMRAAAFKEDYISSEVRAEVFTRASDQVRTFSSNLPVIILHQFNNPILPGNGTVSYMTIYKHQNNNTLLEDPYEIQGRININIRGSSAQSFPKKSYGFHLWNEDGSNRKESLIGMPEEHNWILYGPFSDKTLIRNVLAYEYGRDFGHYAPRTQLIELFLHEGSGELTQQHYHGVYVLVERIKIAPGRLALQEMEVYHTEEPEITGGYIFKKDRLNPGESGFHTQRNSHFAFVRPQENVITSIQKDWLINYLDEFESALFGSNFKDSTDGYRKYIDVTSFIDYHLLTEAFKEIDGYRLSNFMHKDRNGKLKMGPLWDFNLSLGNADYLDGWRPEGWYYSLLNQSDYIYGWYTRLFQDEAFTEAYKRRYRLLRANILSTETFHKKIDDYAAFLEESQQRNFQRWNILGQYVWPNWYIGQTYRDEITWMKQWIANRLAWMDGQLGSAIDQQLIHYWNFNNTAEPEIPDFTAGGATLSFELTDHAEILTGTGQNFEGLNARFGNTAGAHLRINFPIDVSSIYRLPTINYENIVFAYETRRSGSGGNRQYLSYSTDGEMFIPFDTVIVTETPTLYQFDFTGWHGIDNNPLFTIKITGGLEADGSGGDVGNNRYDNVTLEGEIMEGINSPPIVINQLSHKTLGTGSQSYEISVSSLFNDPDGDPLTWWIELENEDITHVSLGDEAFILEANSPGNNYITVYATDEKSGPVSTSITLLQYPAAARLSEDDFHFKEWHADQPEGSFPEHMLFLQSDQSDPKLEDELIYVYNIPANDVASADQDKIGFPYSFTTRTRINGLGADGISFINTGRGRDLGAAVLAVSTENISSVWVQFIAGTLIPNSRVYHLRLQYSIGADGPWLDLDPGQNVEYVRSSQAGHTQKFVNISLPETAMDHSYVLLRWKYYFYRSTA